MDILKSSQLVIFSHSTIPTEVLQVFSSNSAKTGSGVGFLRLTAVCLPWRQIGDKIDHYISCRRSFLIPWKIALRVVVLLSSCRRVLRFVVI